MGQELALVPAEDLADRSLDGKAMSLLPERKRQFVIEMLKRAGKKSAVSASAKACGYHPKYGFYLMRDDDILAAINEEANKHLSSDVLLGVSVLRKIAQNDKHKDQFRAAEKLASLNGFVPEQRMVVRHEGTDSKVLINRIKTLASELGVDGGQLLASIGIVEAEFTEVEEEDGA